MAAKIFRINYKSDFILTLNSDAGWMTPFCIKFWTGAPSQAFFVGWDGETYTHCAFDPSEPTKLLVQFDDHHLPIGDLKFQIAYHFTVEDFPNDTEDEVINPANITTEIDGETYQVMLDFTGETAPEIEFSLPAYANEAQRIANEQQRIAAETQRIANEETRIQNEQTRVAQEQTRQQNETQRIAQESARVSEFASLKSASEAATRDANNAATLANEKAQLAADKAALADGAATQASLNAVYAHDEGQLAGQKAIEAAQATRLAANEAAFAHDQGNYAKNQGDYAKDQGDTALADHVRAEADHGIAVDDHTLAGNDHTRAESDHSTAAADHTTAGNDHTLAESDHGIAADDHTQAGNDHTRAESDHTTAAADHTQAGNDHTRAESDHTRAESDHAAVEVYVDSLGVFDLSKHNAVGGVLATYADLDAALTALNALDSQYKYGGMSFKFVQSSDHKYVQYRLMSDTFNTTPANWQGVDDEPTAGSDNLVKSGGAFLNKDVIILSVIATGGVTSLLNPGEYGWNTTNNTLYYKKSDNTVITISLLKNAIYKYQSKYYQSIDGSTLTEVVNIDELIQCKEQNLTDSQKYQVSKNITFFGNCINIDYWGATSILPPAADRTYGMIWYDTNNHRLRMFDGSSFAIDVPIIKGDVYKYNGYIYIVDTSKSFLSFKQIVFPLDTEPINNSQNGITSGAAYNIKQEADLRSKYSNEIVYEDATDSSAIVYSNGSIINNVATSSSSVVTFILEANSEFLIKTRVPNYTSDYSAAYLYSSDGIPINSIIRCDGTAFDNAVALKTGSEELKLKICTATTLLNKLHVYKSKNSTMASAKALVDSVARVYGMFANKNTINFIPNIFVEGLAKTNNKTIKLNGAGRMLIGSVDNTTEKKDISITVSADGYENYSMTFPYWRKAIANLKNKSIRPLLIGDSLTDMGSSSLLEYIVKCYNKDLGDIACIPIGVCTDTYNWEFFKGYEFTGTAGDEGRSGWCISDYLRHIVHVSPTITNSKGSIGGKAAWDSLGLGTMTRNGSTVRSYVSFSNTEENRELMRHTCHGYYDADPSQELWTWLTSVQQLSSFTYGGVTYQFGSSYSSADDEVQKAAIKYLCTEFTGRFYYVNPFFDIESAALGSGNSSYAFNLSAYLDRYKTIDTNGNRLIVGETAGTAITASTINRHNVCLPTHCAIIMNQNDYANTNNVTLIANDLKLCADLIREYNSGIKVAVGVSRLYGAFNPSEYLSSGYVPEFSVSDLHFNTHIAVRNALYGSPIYYLPIYHIQSVLESRIKGIDTLNHNEILYVGTDLIHPANNGNDFSVIGFIDRIHQIISWINYTLS